MMSGFKTPRFLVQPDFGLLLLRLIVGGMMVAHGVSKLMGGTQAFERVGAHMAMFGIDFAPVFWGFMAALTETIGGLLVMAGFLFRTSCALLLWVMIVATLYHLNADHAFLQTTAHPLKTAAVFLALLFIGPGKFSVQGSAENRH